MFIANPVDAMSFVDMVDAAQTIALGAVATGNINAYEQVMTEDSTKESDNIDKMNYEI